MMMRTLSFGDSVERYVEISPTFVEGPERATRVRILPIEKKLFRCEFRVEGGIHPLNGLVLGVIAELEPERRLPF